MSDSQVADRIRGDRIDILVDLALHTADNRMLVFARKPAPVQVTMLGLPATTGLATIDYRLTDPYLDPPAADGDYTEQSIRLPHCFWCYEPPEEAPPVGPLPAGKNGFVTFGCLNQFAKVSRAAVRRCGSKSFRSCPARDWSFNPRPAAIATRSAQPLPGGGHRPRPRSNSSPRLPGASISTAITTSISASIPSPTTATPARSMRSGWACR